MQRAVRDAVLIAFVALAANFAYLYFSNGDFYFPDSFTYMAPARNLRHGLGFVTEPGVVETMRTPGYPLFLLPFTSMTLVVALQHLMNVGLAIAIYFFTRRRL